MDRRPGPRRAARHLVERRLARRSKDQLVAVLDLNHSQERVAYYHPQPSSQTCAEDAFLFARLGKERASPQSSQVLESEIKCVCF